MAKTAAERTREFRERQKAAAHAALLESRKPEPYLRRSFAEFLAHQSLMLDENLDAFGIRFDGDLATDVQKFHSEYERDEPLTSLQRATGLVDVFIDAAQELACLINQYKLAEIETAIDAALEASSNLPRGDVEALKASFEEIDRLKAIRSDLRKPTRHTFLSVRASGE